MGVTLRVAALVDIHGNLPALDAVLTDIKSLDVDHIVCCGDMVLGGPDDRACYFRMLETQASLIRGNAERYIAEFGTEAADPRWEDEAFGPLRYGVRQFSDSERIVLGQLPTFYRLPEAPEILFYHANPKNDMDIPHSWSTDEEIDVNFSDSQGVLFIGGHSHTHRVREWRGRRIVICGSVGATNDFSAGAQYVLLEKQSQSWSVHHRDVPYDVGETIERFRNVNYIEETGPMGRLMVRTVATRTNQVMPFLAWSKNRPKSQDLSAAVDEFLNLY